MKKQSTAVVISSRRLRASVRTTSKQKTRRATIASPRLLRDVRVMIQQTQERVAIAVNTGLLLLYWHIGRRIREDILKQKRADYGERIVHALSAQLTKEFGSGFTHRNLFNMIRLAEVFPHEKKVHALSAQLSWTHFRLIIPIEDPLKREFYMEMCRIERWSTRTLEKHMGSMLYERTAISRKPRQLIKKELKTLRADDVMTPDLVFRDPYFLDFLNLKDTYSEHDLESAIIHELQQFIIELGGDFAFIARQKRIVIDNEDYYIDLLFYHRSMHRLVAIDLKLGKFTAKDKGQMELYLQWLDRYERRDSEHPPIGLILCAEKSSEHIELLQLHKTGIRVAEYLTQLPPKKLLQRKLHQAIRTARERLARKALLEEKK